MFTQILVPTDGSRESRIAVEQALVLAKEENSRISGLFVADKRLIEAPVHPVRPSATSHDSEINPAILAWIAKTRTQFREQGQMALKAFADLCVMNGIPCKTELVEGLIDETILDRAQQADLIVMGLRGEDTEWQGAPLGSHFEAIVRQSPRPVLGIPARVAGPGHILLAFDGSPCAVRALEIASHLARKRRHNVTMLTVREHPFQIEALSLRARAYLQTQGVSVTHLIRKGHIANTILQTAENEGCNLIILGAYGHGSYLHDRLGSDAFAVLQGTVRPVLICR